MHGIQGHHDHAARLIAACPRLAPSKRQTPWTTRLFEPAATVPALTGPPNEATSDGIVGDVLASFGQGANTRNLHIPLSIDDHALRLILDTGTPVTVVNDDVRNLLGPQNVHRYRFTLKAAGRAPIDIPYGPNDGGTATLTMYLQGGRKVAATMHRPRHLAIGSLPVDIDGQMHVYCAHDNSIGGEQGTDGVAGLDVVQKTILQIDPNSNAVRFLARLPANPGSPVPLVESRIDVGKPSEPVLNRIGVAVQFAGLPDETCWIDTACATPFHLRSELFQQLEAAGAIYSLESAEDTATAKQRANRLGCIRSIRLGPFEHHNVICLEHPTENLLGLDYLQRFIAAIDFSEKKVYLRPSCHYAKSEAELQAFYGCNVLSWLLREPTGDTR